MYVIVLKSKYTGEIFKVLRTMSNQPRKFPEYAIAERVAYETNLENPIGGFEWIAKEDDGIYYKVKDWICNE